MHAAECKVQRRCQQVEAESKRRFKTRFEVGVAGEGEGEGEGSIRFDWLQAKNDTRQNKERFLRTLGLGIFQDGWMEAPSIDVLAAAKWLLGR